MIVISLTRAMRYVILQLHCSLKCAVTTYFLSCLSFLDLKQLSYSVHLALLHPLSFLLQRRDAIAGMWHTNLVS